MKKMYIVCLPFVIDEASMKYAYWRLCVKAASAKRAVERERACRQ
jgi:hypothetical protein